MAKKILLTAKEIDAIDSAIGLFVEQENSILTQRHGNFTPREQWKLLRKLGHPGRYGKG